MVSFKHFSVIAVSSVLLFQTPTLVSADQQAAEAFDFGNLFNAISSSINIAKDVYEHRNGNILDGLQSKHLVGVIDSISKMVMDLRQKRRMRLLRDGDDYNGDDVYDDEYENWYGNDALESATENLKMIVDEFKASQK